MHRLIWDIISHNLWCWLVLVTHFSCLSTRTDRFWCMDPYLGYQLAKNQQDFLFMIFHWCLKLNVVCWGDCLFCLLLSSTFPQLDFSNDEFSPFRFQVFLFLEKKDSRYIQAWTVNANWLIWTKSQLLRNLSEDGKISAVDIMISLGNLQKEEAISKKLFGQYMIYNIL